MASSGTVASVLAASLADKPAKVRATVKRLRQVVRATVPGVRETLNPWSMPQFEQDGPFAYYRPASGHVSFGFLLGTSLPDPHGLLAGTGKNLRHIKLRSPEDLDQPAVVAMIRAAAAMSRDASPMGGRRGPAPEKARRGTARRLPKAPPR